MFIQLFTTGFQKNILSSEIKFYKMVSMKINRKIKKTLILKSCYCNSINTCFTRKSKEHITMFMSATIKNKVKNINLIANYFKMLIRTNYQMFCKSDSVHKNHWLLATRSEDIAGRARIYW